MDKDSRYFATVRRATMIPCSDSKEVNLLSLNGFAGFSAAINFFTSARIAVRDFTTALGIDVTGKEILQFKNASWTMQVFLRGHADIVDSVHFDSLGDIGQPHRFHIFFALLKEGLLLFNDTATHAQ